MHLMCSPLESKEKAHADNSGFMACSPTCGHFLTLLLFPDNGKPGGHINSPAGLVPRNAPAVSEQSLERSRLPITNRGKRVRSFPRTTFGRRLPTDCCLLLYFSGIQFRVDSKPSHSVYECSSADTQSDCSAIRTAYAALARGKRLYDFLALLPFIHLSAGVDIRS